MFSASGFRFFFCSNEGDPREPAYIHVERGDVEAKFWINPDIRVAHNDGSDAEALREVAGSVESNKERAEEAWGEFFD